MYNVGDYIRNRNEVVAVIAARNTHDKEHDYFIVITEHPIPSCIGDSKWCPQSELDEYGYWKAL